MNKLMRKLSISILAVVFAVVAMGATTFAWFTITNTAKINQFEVQVTAGSGFEIAVTTVGGDPSAWKSTITKAEVEAAIGNVVLKDLTSADGATFYPISEIGVDVNGTGTDDYKLGNAVTDGYAKFDIHFRSKADGTVKLNMTETDITSTGKTKVADVAFDEAYTDGDYFTATSNVLAYAMNAARMAIIGSSSTVILEKAGATADVAGTLDNTVGFGTAPAKGALAYYIAKNQIVTTGMDLSGVGTGPDTVKFLDTAYTTAVASIGTGPDANAWYTGKITVRIWLEGWDAECLNVIFSDTLQVKIQFEYTKS